MKQIISKLYPLLLFLILLAGAITCRQIRQPVIDDDMVAEVEDTIQLNLQYGIEIDSLFMTDYTIKSGENLSGIFARLGITNGVSEKILQATRELLQPSKIRAGMTYTAFYTQDPEPEIRYLAFAKSGIDYVVIDLTSDEVNAYEYSKEITLKRYYAEGILNSSLWNTLKSNGTDPLLALKLSDVFAWQIDFFDIKEGDSFRVMYDVAYVDDTTALNIASVSGAVFTHKGKDYVAIPFSQDSISEYFDEEGNSLRKAFLKAPLDFFRITSRFTNSRYHPILKRHRAHHGVDYAAPVGTPVKTIGDGVVIAKGYEKGGGNYLKIKHNAVYTTTYMHLSKFATGLKVGSQVRQGDVVAYVGSTGLSTGPHLDFRVHKNGQPIDPLSMEAPPSEPVKEENRDYFAMQRDRFYMELDSFRIYNNMQTQMAMQAAEANEPELLID